MKKNRAPRSVDAVIRHYPDTGIDAGRAEFEYKPPFSHPTKEELLAALSDEVGRREQGRPRATLPSGIDPLLLARAKAKPMVCGLFPAVERAPVQEVLEKSVIFLSADNIHQIIASRRWLHTAWGVANIYLGSIGAERLGNGKFQALGMGEETTSYVSLEYFTETDPFADYVVHEMAHVFHNWKRAWTGLREIRHREFLLNIKFAMRETFAFGCEVHSRILELGGNVRERRSLLEKFARESTIAGKGEERTELLAILSAAVEARNGWKKILERCAEDSWKARRDELLSKISQSEPRQRDDR